jgi:hypothetical protein
MRALFITITTLALALSGAASTAQPLTAPALGTTSPLGVPGTQTTQNTQTGTGIPLGATEIDPLSGSATAPGGGTIPLGATEIPNAGISPLPGTSCPLPVPGSMSGC